MIPIQQNPHYQAIGGEQGIRALVQRFYRLMDSLPETREIRAMHADLGVAEEKLVAFLSGWMGGPPLYAQKFGPPRLRARHMPFPIDERARDQWMYCMDRAMQEEGLDSGLREQLHAAFLRVANSMRNQGEAAQHAHHHPHPH